MGDDDVVEYTFDCPRCEESLVVNGSMKAALIEKGCVICSADVTAAAFTERTPADST